MMQIAIELPDELGQQILQHGNVQLFVQEAVKRMLVEEQRIQAKEQLRAIMSPIPASVNLADELMAERRLEAEKIQQEK